MNRFFCHVLGEDPARFDRLQPSGRRRIHTLGGALLVPVLLWLVSTFLLVSQVMNESRLVAAIAALFAATLIFLIERSILMAPGNSRFLVGFRVALGLLIAVLGSLSLDEVIFRRDIDGKVAEMKAARIQAAGIDASPDIVRQVAAQEMKVDAAYQAWQQALLEVRAEADGTGGSWMARVGDIVRLKQKQADRLEQVWQAEQASLTLLKRDMARERQETMAEAGAAFQGHGLLIRIRALFALVFSDWLMGIFYILFTLLLVCLEFIIIILKSVYPPTTDERLEAETEALVLEKTRRTIRRIGDHYKGSEDHPVSRSAEAMVLRPVSRVL